MTRVAARVRARAGFYRKSVAVSASKVLQYRVTNYLLIAIIATESVIYLMLWQAVAAAGGGSVGAWTHREIAAYFVVLALVRNMTLTFSPYEFEGRIRSGSFAAALLRPMHPIHADIAEKGGEKLVTIVLWLPVTAALALVFRPELTVTAVELVVFVLALWGAFLLRTLYLWLLGMTTFWTTRASAAFDLFLVLELLLSGRLVPLSLLPPWLADIAEFLPFRWVFGFPVESLVADLPARELLAGLGMQALWAAAGSGAVALMWRSAVRRHTAVGT
ncbi:MULTISPECIES: ABC transporter permease [Actinomadura]|uniref:ABC-2 type transport system permease protein n=1 Tax=Actinomadura madurae TaxID=1993 RepID=A0A1I5IFF1_9ACTN|nr:ABC-2 family transporter protein [Actinomadura madurae]SFO58771.1 ABC-2 type transport system permease protein [Actinomadura madurae]SPT57306.1 ABC-type uncharacterized transport system, permease component [Actinomadura madurae]